MAWQRNGAAKESERNGYDRERPEQPPVEIAGAIELVRAERRYKDVQYQRDRPHLRRRDAGERERREIRRGAAVPDRGVAEGGDQHARGEKRGDELVHAALYTTEYNAAYRRRR